MLAVAASTPPDDWSTKDLSTYGDVSEYAQTRAVCARLIHAAPPSTDRPSSDERKALKGCDSEALYYGIGVTVDTEKARKCAVIQWQQGENENLNYFFAEGMLMTIYANGRGARRNLDVAIHMACQLEDAPAATDGRIKRLLELKEAATGDDFSPCDDATSGISSGFCAEHAALLGKQDRARRIHVLARSWTPQQRLLFDRAYRSFGDYAGTAHEMDCWRGTLQSACTISGTETDVERFLKRIEILSRGSLPPKDAPPEDAGFNAATNAAATKESMADVDKDDRAWYETNAKATIAARRTFERNLVGFAAVAFPRLSSHRIRQIFSDL